MTGWDPTAPPMGSAVTENGAIETKQDLVDLCRLALGSDTGAPEVFIPGACDCGECAVELADWIEKRVLAVLWPRNPSGFHQPINR